MKNLLGCMAIVVVFVALLVLPASAQTEGTKKDADVRDFESVIQTILAGSDLSHVRGKIHPEAYIIHGKTYESIFNLMSESSRRQLFGSAHQNEIKFFHAYINDAKTTAFVVVKTGGANTSGPRFHTVVFVKSAEKGWQLLHWHTSTSA